MTLYSAEPVKVGIVGLGTVGGGAFNILRSNADEIARRVGRPIEIAHVSAKYVNPDCELEGIRFSNDAFALVADPELHIVVELMGGTTVAREVVLSAIRNGKHVVTANKALIAEHGNEIFQEAHDKGVDVAFEAAAAGGIPLLTARGEGRGGGGVRWHRRRGLRHRGRSLNRRGRDRCRRLALGHGRGGEGGQRGAGGRRRRLRFAPAGGQEQDQREAGQDEAGDKC